MSEHGMPVAAVLDDMCRVCGGDEMDRHEGHKYQAFPWPQLPVELAEEVMYGHATWAEEGALRATARGTVWRAEEKFEASVWLWSESWSMAGHDRGLAAEWKRLDEAVRVQLARLLCPHVDHNVYAGVARILADDATAAVPPAIGYHMDLRAWCADCGEPFVFVGDQLQVGVRPDMPTVDVPGTTLAAPLRPRSTPEGWGRDRPGFTARARR